MSVAGAITKDRIARSVLQGIAAQADRTSQESSAVGAAFLGQTTTDGTYPAPGSNPQVAFLVTPQEIDADDTEGATATFTGDTDNNMLALNLGGSVPPQGSLVIVSAVGGRYCFRFD